MEDRVTVGDLIDWLETLPQDTRIVQWGHAYHSYKEIEEFARYDKYAKELHI